MKHAWLAAVLLMGALPAVASAGGHWGVGFGYSSGGHCYRGSGINFSFGYSDFGCYRPAYRSCYRPVYCDPPVIYRPTVVYAPAVYAPPPTVYYPSAPVYVAPSAPVYSAPPVYSSPYYYGNGCGAYYYNR